MCVRAAWPLASHSGVPPCAIGFAYPTSVHFPIHISVSIPNILLRVLPLLPGSAWHRLKFSIERNIYCPSISPYVLWRSCPLFRSAQAHVVSLSAAAVFTTSCLLHIALKTSRGEAGVEFDVYGLILLCLCRLGGQFLIAPPVLAIPPEPGISHIFN